ncbi:DUF4942 domain-containing protein [Pectobacterium brasiliense]|nr:DUF4942 domain-containing protein [Pectobacterium brasiliense]
MAILVNGKPIPDNRGNISTRLMEHIQENPAKETYEDEFFSIRYFQKGTAHLTFKRLELVERMKDIITKHYPKILSSKKTKVRILSKNMTIT